MAYGEGIPPAVKRYYAAQYPRAEEFRLNGSTVDERFGQGNKKFLFVTKTSDYDANPPSGVPGSTLTAQMRQLATLQSDRVLTVKFSDEELTDVEGQLDTDGDLTDTPLNIERVQQQPANAVQRGISTDSKLLNMVESMHKMVFSK